MSECDVLSQVCLDGATTKRSQGVLGATEAVNLTRLVRQINVHGAKLGVQFHGAIPDFTTEDVYGAMGMGDLCKGFQNEHTHSGAHSM